MPRIPIGNADDMPVNSVRQIIIPSCPAIAMCRLPAGFFATEDRCSHGDASLSEGEVDGEEIVCPFHLGRFDIRTGEASAAPCITAIQCYAVTRGDDGRLYLDLP